MFQQVTLIVFCRVSVQCFHIVCAAQPSGPCWFCLASPQVEKHLVISIGTHVSEEKLTK